MKTRHMAGTLCMVLLTLAAGCGKPDSDSLTKDFLGKMKDLTATLHNVTDDSSAKANADTIKAQVTAVKQVQQQIFNLPKPTDDQQKAIQDKYGKDIQDTMTGFEGELMRVESNPTLAGPLQNALSGMDGMDPSKQPTAAPQ